MNNLVAKHMKTFQKGAGEHRNKAYEAKNSCLVSDEDLMYYQLSQEESEVVEDLTDKSTCRKSIVFMASIVG
ncbi:MAG: hypothetical protein E6R13_06575 [Spirochaetes bacterium]|jgi:hypothetical protein|nr:MAG: hypothetical protein E6R13_06575 [Spirochaetota bacterium]